MTAFAAHVDDNQQFTSTGVVGTLGTADEQGTAKALPIAVDDASGAVFTKIINGTLNSVTSSGGTDVNIITGTVDRLHDVGTIGSITNIGVLHNGTIVVGSIGNIGQVHNAGTIAAHPSDTFAADGQAYGKGVLVQGDDGADRRAIKVDTSGRVDVSAISSVVDDAAFTPGSDRPFPIGGFFDDDTPDSVDEHDLGIIRMSARREMYTQIRDAAGNERGVNVNASNQLSVDIDAFSVDLPGGTLDAGTVTVTTFTADIPGGTIDLVSSVANLDAGTISMLHAGTIDEASVIGGAASGAAASGNPLPVAGTDGGGTVYTMLVDTAGNPQVDIVNTPSVTVPDPLGSVTMTVGTVTTGSLTNLATLHNGTVVVSTVSNIVGGTILNSGTTTGVGVVSNLTNGTVRVAAGTQQTLGTVGVLNNGTLAQVTSVSNVASGTVKINHVPVTTGTSYGTLGTAGAATWGTLIAAAGAGTKQYVSGLSIIVHSGTVDCAITNVGTVATIGGAGILARGQFVPSGGIMRDFTIPTSSGANGTLAYRLGGAGTVWFSVNYWQGV